MGDDDAAPVLGRRSALSGEARIIGNAGALRMRMRSAGGRSICFGWLCEGGYTLSGLLAASACTELLREEISQGRLQATDHNGNSRESPPVIPLRIA